MSLRKETSSNLPPDTRRTTALSVAIWMDLEDIFSLPFGVGAKMKDAADSIPRARQGDDLEYFLPPIVRPKVTPLQSKRLLAALKRPLVQRNHDSSTLRYALIIELCKWFRRCTNAFIFFGTPTATVLCRPSPSSSQRCPHGTILSSDQQSIRLWWTKRIGRHANRCTTALGPVCVEGLTVCSKLDDTIHTEIPRKDSCTRPS